VLADILLRDGDHGVEVLQNLELAAALPPTWRGLADRAIDFHHTRVGSLPLRELELSAAQAGNAATLETQRHHLRDRVEKLRKLRQRFSFDSGTALHDALFAKDGLLGLIGSAAADGLDAFPELRPKLPHDVRRHMGQLIKDAGERPMVWHKHVNFLSNVEDIVRSARNIADGAGRAAPPPDELPQVRASEHIGRYAADHWEQLFAQATGTIPRPYDLPPRALLDALTPLVRWTREQQ
jgi:hypothetical protein